MTEATITVSIAGEPSADNSSGESSTNNDFIVVNDGDVNSNCSRQSSTTRLNDVTERASLEEKLRDAAIESGEDSTSNQSAQECSAKQWPGIDKPQSDIDIVSLLVGSTEMLSSEKVGGAGSGDAGIQGCGPGSQEREGEHFDNTFLHGVTYLGCSRIDNTAGAEGALSVMLDLKREAMSALPVTLAVPTNSNGHLRLITPGTEEIQFAVPIRNIACCTRGNLQEIQDCLGFVVSQPTRMPTQHYSSNGDQVEGESYLCHVVQFAALETITAALNSFSQAFGVNAMPPGGLHSILGEEPLLLVQFAVSVRENDSKQSSGSMTGSITGSYSPNLDMKFSQNVPRDKNCLKMRQSFLKKVEIAVRVVSEPQLPIERTCGFFIQFHDTASSVKNCNYELLDHLDTAMGYSPTDGSREMIASGILDPNLPQFALFNSLTGKAGLLYSRFALDVVFLGIESPVRFHLPVACKIMSKNERFFYPNRRPCLINYIINLKAIPDTDSSYRVEGLKCECDTSSSSGGLAGSLFGLAGGNSTNQSLYDFTADDAAASGGIGINTADFFGGSEADSLHQQEEDSADEEILISGFGSVSKDCSEEVLEKWGELIKEWTNTEMPISPEATTEAAAAPPVPTFSFGASPVKGRPQPKAVRNLVRTVGIPEALRGEVWHRQVGTEDTEELCQKYRQFLEQECVNEDQIKRDIHRTFPANDFFKEDQGPGQEALLKLTKAYSQYDQEIGYCQGFTYIAAVLLLHMPEEQAFCVFVRLMGLFKLRELYKQDFYELKLKWFQLDYLVRDHIPTLYYHFQAIGLKSHMFSSQWFLTLYTAKFPLYLVYRIYDIIFSEGLSFLLNVALALLREASEELCRKTFEECNTYIKANIPRKYRDEAAADDLIRKALQMKINQKKLAAYAKEYYHMVQREERLKDPMERLKVEQQESHAKIMSLEAEAVNLANELVNAKMDAQRKVEAVEEKVSQIQAMFQSTHEELSQMQETKQQLETENEHLKKIVEFETKEANKQKEIVSEYRKLCSDRERERDQQVEVIKKIKNVVSKYPECNSEVEAILNGEGDSTKTATENGTHVDHHSIMRASSNRTSLDSVEDSAVQIEQELALTKLKLVEEQSYNQQLEHEVAELRQLVNTMNSSTSNQNASSAAAQWLLKRTPSFLSRNSQTSAHNHSNPTTPTGTAHGAIG